MRNLKVINVAVFVTGCEGYGAQRSLLNQYRASKDFGIEFHYVCLHKGDLYQKLVNADADVKVIGGPIPKPYPPNLFKVVSVFLSTLRPNFRVFRKLRAYLKEQKPDLVYSHMLTEQILGGLAAKSCWIKSVGHFNGMLNPKRNFGLSRVIVSMLFNFVLDMGISISETVRESLWGPMKAKTYRIYNGLNTQAIKRRGEQLAQAKDCDGADVVSVGRLVSIKKQDILIQAISILAKQGLELDLILVGGPAEDSNPYYRKLKQQIAEIELSDRVRFTGYVKEPYGIITKSKASVLCCSTEGFGYVVPEAMACRTPVIVADAGGPSELVEHDENGLKFTPNNADELAECLRMVITDKERAERYAGKAYADVLKNYTIDSHMRQLRERFCDILNWS